MKTSLFIIHFLLLTAQVAAGITWTANPGSASSGQAYTVSAQGTYHSSYIDVSVTKNGAFFASNSGFASVTAGASATDYGVQTVNYYAEAYAVTSYYGPNGEPYEWFHSTTTTVAITSPPNTAPSNTLTSPSAQTIALGTALTITSHATDAEGNITTHNLDIQRPDGTWNWQGGFASGEPFMGGPVGSGGSSTRSAVFTFNQTGVWNLRSWVNDSNGANTYSSTVQITVTKASQTISFPNPGTVHRDANSIALSAVTSSGLPVSFSVLSGPATVSGATLTFTGTGNVTVRAAQSGDGTYAAAPSVDRLFLINANPTITQAILDGTNTLLASRTVSAGVAAGAASTALEFGQSWKFRVSGSDPDANLSQLYLRVQRPGGGQGANPSPPDFNWSGSFWQRNHPVTPTNSATYTSALILADQIGTWVLWSHASDAPALSWGSVNPWSGNQWGWQSTDSAPVLTVTKATPAGTFAARTITPSGSAYSVQAADLNAVFSNPHSSAVPSPTGTVTYHLVATSAPVGPGTNLNAGATYQIRATYSGDANYLAATKDAFWTIQAPPGDADNDGVPDDIEQQLGTNKNDPKQDDVSSQTKLNLHRPTPN